MAYSTDKDGRACIEVKNNDGSSITVYEQGAHLSSWVNDKGQEKLYLSPCAVKKDRYALRGGVPLIFPQFGNRGPLTPSHGFARLRPWTVTEVGNGHAAFTLHVSLEELSAESGSTLTANNAVELTYTIEFCKESLVLSMQVRNLSEELAASFQFCFHTYFRVADISKTIVNGFNRSPFYDQTKKIDGKNESMKLNKPENLWLIQNGDEVDRIYPKQACAILLQEPQSATALHISSTTMPDVVLWNPGMAKCKKTAEDKSEFADLPEDGYKNFVCVEHGYVMNRIAVPASSSLTLSQKIRVVSATPAESKI